MSEAQYHVKVGSGPSKGEKFEVKTEAVVLGSGKEADIIIEGPGVEPRHAQIVYAGGSVKLEDLGTEAGTSRNGQRLLGPVNVFPGDRIGLGPEVELILQGDDPREAQKDTDMEPGTDAAPGVEGLAPEN